MGVAHDYEPAWWASYVAVNQAFASEVAAVAATSGTVWIHDYHLMLAPQAIRTHRPDVVLGYFHHIPFPGPDVLALSHQPQALVEGLLGSDLIGFQRERDRENFVECVPRFVPGASVSSHTVSTGSGDDARHTTVGVYPISIDFSGVAVLAASATGYLPKRFEKRPKAGGASVAGKGPNGLGAPVV